MLSYNKLNLLLGCFNQNVFSDAKMNIDLIRVFYAQDPYSKNNSLINKLLHIIDHYKFQDITEALFISTFQSDGKTDAEIADLIGRIKEYKTYTKDQSKVFRDDLKEICYQGYINRAKYKFPEDPVGFAEEIKKFNYKTNVSNNLSVKLFNELDITDLAQMYSGEGYKSSFKFINDSFTCGGYIPGQIVGIVSPPGNGKSLFVQNEVVNFIKQGKRVHLMILGDLNELDVATRLTCMMAKRPKRVIESDIVTYFSMYKDKFSDLLSITIVPSGVVTGQEYIDWMLDRIDEYDVLVIDYDSNFKKSETSSMYDIYGDLYDLFTQLSRHQKLIFVCSQPKICYYNAEEIPMDGIGESSRKQHILDMIITIGRRQESKMRMGKMQIVKSRRGDLNQALWIGTSEGLFYECSKVLYARYRSQQEYIGLYTYDELQSMDVLGDVFSDDEIKDIQ
jgi:hypothetical protein